MGDRTPAGSTGCRALQFGIALGAGVLLRLACPGVARAEDLVPIAGSRPEVASELAAEAAAPPKKSLRMQLYLAPRNEAELRRLLRRQHDPASPDYYRWLSAAEYEARFGPTRADVDALTAWLATHGFSVTHADVAQGRIAFEGDVATASAAFRVAIAGSRDGKYFANVADPMLPASLAAKVRHIAGLHNASASVMHTQITDPTNNNGLLSNHFGPTDVWTYSDERSLLDAGMNGAGQCIAALEGSDVDQASLGDFDTVFGLPPLVVGQNFASVFPDGPPGVAPPGSQGGSPPYAEALVDLEYAHGIAPGAEIVLYAGNFPGLGTQGLVDTLRAATTDNRCGAITISWAQCGEPKSFFRMLNDSYARGAAQGQSIFVATGDVGVGAPAFSRKTHGCVARTKPGIEENAGSPNVTAIGATEISPPQFDASGNDTGVGVPPEAVWFIDVIEHRIKSASTGGVSAIFAKPRYQKGVKSAHFRKRAVPDICFGGTASSPGYWECLDLGLYSTGNASGPTCTVGGGTSVAAPQWAGILAILMQKKGSRFGNINPLLYAMASANLGNLSAVGIRDVTDGNNGFYPIAGYVAGPGFDLASGWGSIDVAQFATAFTAFVPPHKK